MGRGWRMWPTSTCATSESLWRGLNSGRAKRLFKAQRKDDCRFAKCLHRIKRNDDIVRRVESLRHALVGGTIIAICHRQRRWPCHLAANRQNAADVMVRRDNYVCGSSELSSKGWGWLDPSYGSACAMTR